MWPNDFVHGLLAVAVTLAIAQQTVAAHTAPGKDTADQCVVGHGVEELVKLPGVRNLAGQNEVFLSKALKDDRSGTREHTVMSMTAKSSSDDHVAGVAACSDWLAINANASCEQTGVSGGANSNPGSTRVLSVATVPDSLRADQASTALVEGCRQQGVNAERLAVARDHGMSIEQAIATVAEHDPRITAGLLKENAELLFHRFRNMPVEQVALEFTAACLDDEQ